MIGIIDYGAGNLSSVKNALDYLGVESKFICSPKDYCELNKIILPGVGAFESAIEKLKSSGTYELIIDWLNTSKPFLGICLGMQILFEESEESKGAAGLGIFKGSVVHFKNLKVPQIGWNQVKILKQSKMLKGLDESPFFYFLHGYFVKPQNEDIVVGTTEYGVEYTSIIEKGNIFAVQFHPERSGKIGIQLLKNWVKLC